MTRRSARLRRAGAAGSILVLLSLVAGIFRYSAVAMERRSDAALFANTVGRLRGDAEGYVNDVVLVAGGSQADPSRSMRDLEQIDATFASGGRVPALQGGGEVDLHVPPKSKALRAKLAQQTRLIASLRLRGERVLQPGLKPAEQRARLLELRVIGAQLVSVTSDIEGQITDDSRAALERLNRIQVVLAVLVGGAALGVGNVFLRTGRKLEEGRYRALANHSTDLVTVVDPDSGSLRYVSPSARTILGLGPDELLGTPFVDLVHPDDRALVAAVLADIEAHPDAPETAEYRVRHADGRWCAIESGWSNLVSDPAVRGFVANSRDVSDRRALESELRDKAFRDDLTGLPNRALFGDRVEQAVERARRKGGTVTVLFVDLDDFKTVNDSLGHRAGDHLLGAVASRLRGCIRPTDTAARLGGDEFGILLDDGSTIDTAESLAERLIGVLREPVHLEGHPRIVVGASVGIACQPATDLTADELLRDADVAMYVAKAAGKGRVEVFAPKMHDDVVERQMLSTDLQMALKGGQLEVYYQPLVELESRRVKGVEALLRWHHPTRGMVPPLAFVPLAEEMGTIVEIGAWVLEQACTQIREWSSRHPAVADLTVTVNISPVQLATDRLFDDVRRALTRSGLRPGQLVLEITESAIVGDPSAVVEKLLSLRTLGIRLAIDDFGTGYSSLSQLRQLPVDMLKIDKSFVDDAADEGEGRALLHSIIDLGRVLNLEILAEGIEDGDQAEELRKSSAHLGQGFFYARPAAPADLEGVMEAGTLAPVADSQP